MANDIVVKDDVNIALAKSKKLFDITNKILGNRDKNRVVEVKKSSEVLAHKISDDQNRPIEFEDNILAWIDKDTGLMWEVKTKENIKHEYVWSEEWIERADAPEDLTDDVKDAFSYAEKLNKMNYAGFSDWRVPTIEELKTILTEETSKTKGFKGDYYYTKEPLSKNTNYYYWSSTPYARYASNAWVVYFVNGYDNGNAKSYAGYVRCVR